MTQGGDAPSNQSDAGSGTRHSRGHWGILDNVIGGPGRRQRLATAISGPRAKAAPRRKFVLRYPTLEYQHEQPSHIQHGWKPKAPSRSPSRNGLKCTSELAEGRVRPLDREKPYQSRPIFGAARTAPIRGLSPQSGPDIDDGGSVNCSKPAPALEQRGPSTGTRRAWSSAETVN